MDFNSGASATSPITSRPHRLHLVISAKSNGSPSGYYDGHNVHPVKADRKLSPGSSSELTPSQQAAIDHMSRYLSALGRVTGLQQGCCCQPHEEATTATEAIDSEQAGSADKSNESSAPGDMLSELAPQLPEAPLVQETVFTTSPEPAAISIALADQQAQIDADHEYAQQLQTAFDRELIGQRLSWTLERRNTQPDEPAVSRDDSDGRSAEVASPLINRLWSTDRFY